MQSNLVRLSFTPPHHPAGDILFYIGRHGIGLLAGAPATDFLFIPPMRKSAPIYYLVSSSSSLVVRRPCAGSLTPTQSQPLYNARSVTDDDGRGVL